MQAWTAFLVTQTFTEWTPTTTHSAGTEGGKVTISAHWNVWHPNCILSTQKVDCSKAVASSFKSADNASKHPFLDPEQQLSCLMFPSLLVQQMVLSLSRLQQTTYWAFHFYFWSYCPNLYFVLCLCLWSWPRINGSYQLPAVLSAAWLGQRCWLSLRILTGCQPWRYLP